MSIRSCTCSSNLTDFLPIRQEFVFFTRGGRKGLRYPGSEIVHVRWSSNFEKCGGTIVKLSFGGCFTKHPFLGLEKWKMALENDLIFIQHKCVIFECRLIDLIFLQILIYYLYFSELE